MSQDHATALATIPNVNEEDGRRIGRSDRSLADSICSDKKDIMPNRARENIKASKYTFDSVRKLIYKFHHPCIHNGKMTYCCLKGLRSIFNI